MTLPTTLATESRTSQVWAANSPLPRQSHVARWIEEQQYDETIDETSETIRKLGMKKKEERRRKKGRRESEGIQEFEVVERIKVTGEDGEPLEGPETLGVKSGRLHGPSSLRRMLRPSTPSPGENAGSVSHKTPVRSSFSAAILPRILRNSHATHQPAIDSSSGTHSRSSSLSALFTSSHSHSHDTPHPHSATITPKSRPSVVKHFASAYFLAPDSATAAAATTTTTTRLTAASSAQPTWEDLPRPSLNSVRTCATSHTSTSDAHGMRSHTAATTASSLFSSPAAASSHSLWSTSQGHSSLPGSVPPISDDTCDPSSHRPRSSGKLLNNGVVRVPLADKDSHPPMFTKPPPTPLNDSRPYVAYAPSNHSSFSAFVSSTRGRNYKKLVISGIGVDEHKRFDGVRRWCESFGQVRCITRMQNGDLHVHFKDPQVADTVCRIRAKVFIAGVGSVSLSWYTGTSKR